MMSSDITIVCIFFFKQKTAYEMRISDWSSDVCSSDLQRENFVQQRDDDKRRLKTASSEAVKPALQSHIDYLCEAVKSIEKLIRQSAESLDREKVTHLRSEEHTSELQSLMRISYAVFCLKKKKHK